MAVSSSRSTPLNPTLADDRQRLSGRGVYVFASRTSVVPPLRSASSLRAARRSWPEEAASSSHWSVTSRPLDTPTHIRDVVDVDRTVMAVPIPLTPVPSCFYFY